MSEEKLSIEIELCGYKGRITHIGAKEADLPWYPEDSLYVFVTFDEPYPEGILTTFVTIPAKEYTRENLLAVVKTVGERQFAETMARSRKESEKYAFRQKRREELNALAKKVEEVLGDK